MSRKIKNINYVKDEYANGRSIRDLAREFSVDRNTIKNVLLRENISIRDCSQSMKACGCSSNEKHHAWKGGNSFECKTKRSGEMWENARKECFARDNHGCVICGKSDGLIEIHHIDPVKNNVHTLDNLQTLCRLHHSQKHNLKGDDTSVRILGNKVALSMLYIYFSLSIADMKQAVKCGEYAVKSALRRHNIKRVGKGMR